MAGRADKKLAAGNDKHLNVLFYGMIIVNILFLFFRVFLFGDSCGFWHWVGFIACDAVLAFIYLQFSKQVSSGLDINTPGVNEYMHDTVYIIWGVLGLCWITEWFWFILLVIPGYAIYKAWTLLINPYIQASKNQPQFPTEPTETRKERRAKK